MENIPIKLATEIAVKQFRVETLEPRHRDSLDFHEVSVRSIYDALNEAYKAGQKSKTKS